MGGPDIPAPPNPGVVAAAQTAANISASIASIVLSNAHEDSPSATVEYNQIGSYTYDDPQVDPTTGSVTSTITRSIPIWKRTVEFKPKGQEIFDKQQDLSIAVNDLGLSQVRFLAGSLGTAFSLAALPAGAPAPAAPTLARTFADVGGFPATVGSGDFERERREAIDAVYDRIRWQHEQNRAISIARLSNQGIFPGMEAYDRELRTFDQAVTDAVSAAVATGGQEHSRLFGLEVQRGEFELASQAQRFQQTIIRFETANKADVAQFELAHKVADYVNTFRERSLQEAITERSTALNELSVMMRGGQIQLPVFSTFKGSTVQAGDFQGAAYKSFDAEMQVTKYRHQRQMDMIKGVASIVGAVAGMPGAGAAMGGGGGVGAAMPMPMA